MTDKPTDTPMCQCPPTHPFSVQSPLELGQSQVGGGQNNQHFVSDETSIARPHLVLRGHCKSDPLQVESSFFRNKFECKGSLWSIVGKLSQAAKKFAQNGLSCDKCTVLVLCMMQQKCENVQISRNLSKMDNFL